MRIKTLLMALLLAFTVLAPAFAGNEPSVKPAKLGEREQKDIVRIESYLNTLKSVSADFLQVGDSGALRHGHIDIQRPGKMRVVYDAPDKDFMVADGSFLNIWDGEMQQQTSIPLGSGIADFILRDKIALSGDVVITRFTYYPAKIEISLVAPQSPEQGELTLVFEDKPLQLRQWRVLDTQGHTTGVNLEEPREGVTFSSGIFTFESPNLGKTQHSGGK